MHFSEIKYCDIANGPGVRVSLFVSGCTRHCKDCFNEVAWDFEYGPEFSKNIQDYIIEFLNKSYIDGLTILGGEPMEPKNQKGVSESLKRVREEAPKANIWLFSGYELDKDIQPKDGRVHTEYTDDILNNIDMLVDGPFIAERKNISLKFRGSENQRIIKMPATLREGKIVLWEDM